MNPVFLRALLKVLDENRMYCTPMLLDGEYDIYRILVKAIERGDLSVRKEILDESVREEEERCARMHEDFLEKQETKNILRRLKKYLKR